MINLGQLTFVSTKLFITLCFVKVCSELSYSVTTLYYKATHYYSGIPNWPPASCIIKRPYTSRARYIYLYTVEIIRKWTLCSLTCGHRSTAHAKFLTTRIQKEFHLIIIIYNLLSNTNSAVHYSAVDFTNKVLPSIRGGLGGDGDY